MWDWFINFLVWVIETFADWFGDYGLAIIAMTIIFRLLLMPLTMRQLKSSARMQVLQPKLQEIQDRYADDPMRMQEEMRKFQAENNFNPLGGCLPLLLQWPIFFALFGALRTISTTHPDAGFLSIMPSISQSAAGALAEWGIGGAIVYIIMDVAFGVLTFVPMLLTTSTQSEDQMRQTRIMGAVMGVMMIWMGWNVAGGVLLYYDTSSIWGVIQQRVVTNRVISKAKAEEEERLKNMPVKVDVVRKERKPRPKKKS